MTSSSAYPPHDNEPLINVASLRLACQQSRFVVVVIFDSVVVFYYLLLLLSKFVQMLSLFIVCRLAYLNF